MSTAVKALYYPDFFVDQRTLVKSILLFDEIHLTDRPSITFSKGGQFGTIGADSPLRQFEASFRDNGVPLYVHKPYSGPIPADWYEKVKADISDPAFLAAFVQGLRNSEPFRSLMIAKGNYGEIGNEEDVLRAYLDVDAQAIEKLGGAVAVFEDDAIRHMDLKSVEGRAKSLIATAAICAAKINQALGAGAAEGFSPLADAKPFADLLGVKYRRAAAMPPISAQIHVSDLSFAVLDELLSKQKVESLSIKEAVEYRKASNDERKAFMQHMSLLETKYGKFDVSADYSDQLERLVETEIRPAARQYRNALAKIDDTLVGQLGKGAFGALGGSSLVQMFSDLSLPHILALAGLASAYVGKSAIDAIVARRAADRECALSYLLSLD